MFYEAEGKAKRVLILSTSIGTGHTRAAQALEQAFRASEFKVTVRHEDALQFANSTFRKMYQQTYIDLVANAPDLLGWAYDAADKSIEKFHYGIAFERVNIHKLAILVKEFKPDVVICTHSLPADLISSLLCKKEIDCHHAIVITDFDLHSIWLCQHYSRYFVALDETRRHMIELAFDPSRVIVSGIPVHSDFAQKKDKTQMRIKHNLAPNLTTILICANGLGDGSIDEILNQLPELLATCQVIIACGANPSLYKKLQAFAENLVCESLNHCHVLKFTAEIDEYMSASDLIVGKPGGLTSAEALAEGLIFVIVNPIPGQEERNADHLLEEGVAIRCNNLPVLSYKIERLLADRERLEIMRKNALAMARPHAADEVVSQVMALVHSNESVGILKAHVCDGAIY